MRLGLNLGLCSLFRGSTPAEPTAPGQFSALQWSLARTGSSNALAVAIASLPSSGGSAITTIKYSLDGGTLVDAETTGDFTISGLTLGTEYDVQILATNAIRDGTISAVKSATPATAPAAPLLALTAGDGQVSVAWTDGSANGSAITSHKLYRGTASGSLTLLGTILSSSPYVDDTVTNGTEYFYQISAVNDVDEGSLSTEQSATPAVAPEPSGTLTVVYDAATMQASITNTADFPGGTWSWQDENLDYIAGQTGSTLARADIPEGLMIRAVANGDIGTASQWLLPELDLVEYDQDFSGVADGTLLDGFDGWDVKSTVGTDTTAPQIVIRGGEVRMEGNPGTRNFVRQMPTSGPKKVTIFNFRDNTAPVEAIRTTRNFYLYWNPASYTNSIRLNHLANGIGLFKTVAGTGTTFAPSQASTTSSSTESIGVLVGNGIARTLIDDVESVVSYDEAGWDVSDVPENNWIMFQPPANSWPTDHVGSYRMFSRILVERVLALAFFMSSYSTVKPSATQPTTVHTFVGTCTSSITHFDWCVVNRANGRALTDWVKNVPVDSAGNWSIETTLPATAEGGADFCLAMRPTANVESLSILEPGRWAIEGNYPYTLPMWGMQASNVAGWSEEDIYTDRSMIGAWSVWGDGAWSEYDIPIKANGTPDIEAVPDYTAAYVKLWESGRVGYGRGGEYLVSWDMDNVTASWHNGSAGVVYGAIDNVAKTARITIPEMTMVNAHLRFTPTGGGPAGSDFEVSCVRVGETATGPINDKALPAMSSQYNSIYRFMKMQGMESPYDAIEAAPYLADKRRAKPELMGLMSNQMDNWPWFCLPTNENDAWTLDFATRLKTTLRTGVPILLEWGNELIWNKTYQASTNWATVRGLNDGLATGIPAPTGEQFQNAIGASDDPWTSGETGETNRVIPAGARAIVNANNYQWTALEAKTELPVGYVIPDIRPAETYEDADIKIWGTYNALVTGAHRYILKRTHEVKQIFQSVFGSDNEIRTIYSTQKSSSIPVVVERLTYNPTWGKSIWAVSPSHYIDSTGSWSSAPAWAKDPANAAAWQAGLRDLSIEKLTELVAKHTEYKQLFTLLRQQGWESHEIPGVGSYEGELHFRLDEVPSANQADVAARIVDWRASDDAYNLIYSMMEQLDAVGLLFHVDFALHQWPGRVQKNNDQFGYLRGVNTYNDPVTGAQDKKWHARADYLAATRP